MAASDATVEGTDWEWSTSLKTLQGEMTEHLKRLSNSELERGLNTIEVCAIILADRMAADISTHQQELGEHLATLVRSQRSILREDMWCPIVQEYPNALCVAEQNYRHLAQSQALPHLRARCIC
jgi:hypothetical protein